MSDLTKYLEKAEKHLRKGKLEAALEYYQQALQLDPGNDVACLAAADIYLTLKRNGAAAEVLGELLDRQLASHDPAAQVTYKKLMLTGAASWDRMMRFGHSIERSNRKEATEIYRTAAHGMAKAGKKKGAIAALKRLGADSTLEDLTHLAQYALDVGDATLACDAYFQAGEMEEQHGRDPLPWFRRALEQDPENAAAVVGCARALLQKRATDSALEMLEPLATGVPPNPQARELYAQALLAAGKAAEAVPFAWEQFERNPKEIATISGVVTTLLRSGEDMAALGLVRRLEAFEAKRGRRSEFIALITNVAEGASPSIPMLEYLAELYNTANREQEYCRTVLRLFDLYYAAGQFLRAGDALDRAAEVDAYDPGHQKRLEMLQGKLEANRMKSIAARLGAANSRAQEAQPAAEKPAAPAAEDSRGEPTVLEDFMLQAEIFLQYSLRARAVERLERIRKLFPGEETHNAKLRNLLQQAGLLAGGEAGAEPEAEAPAPATTAAAAPAAVPTGQGISVEQGDADHLTRITEITRNVHRQGTVNNVLFAVVNDVGRQWAASRCIAALLTPGKPPSATAEYCAPGMPKSPVGALVKVVTACQELAVVQGTVNISDAATAPELAAVRDYVAALNVESLLALPLMDGERHAGILILAQTQARRWRSSEAMLLKTIADQAVLAVNNVRLRTLMRTLAVTDEKSGLLKRSSYLDVVLAEVRRAMAQNSTCSIMLLNVGRAGALVKEIGEAQVESMMQQVGQTLASTIRQNDVAIRYDLTTIAFVLGDTPEKNVFLVVDKFRRLLQGMRVPATSRPVQVTAGIAEAVMLARFDPVDIVTELINRAEAALDVARSEGGNRAHSLGPPVLETVAVAG